MVGSKAKRSKLKSYNRGKRERTVKCECGGSYVEGVYSDLPAYKHVNSKIHQAFLSNGNVMDTKVKARLDKKEADKKADLEEKKEARRGNQILCDCGSYYNKMWVDGGKGQFNHFSTAKHVKWTMK